MSHRPFNPLFWALTRIGHRLTPGIPKAVDDAGGIPAPSTLLIPTRHGMLPVLVFELATVSSPRPVVIHLHGGGFINRHPEQDRHIARHIARRLQATVLLPDYRTAPYAQYPIAEEQAGDAATWVLDHAAENGWDLDRFFVSGASAGAKLAINICQQLHHAGRATPAAAALIVPVTDVTRTDRTSTIKHPAISPLVQRMVRWGYFPDPDRRHEPLASPRFDASLAVAMPPTLVITAEHDTLAPEGRHLGNTLADAGVATHHHQYPGADHSFYADKPAETIEDLLNQVGTWFQDHEHHAS